MKITLPKTSGIYTITNQIDNKIYVGYTNNFRYRYTDHVNDLKGNRHCNTYLQNAWNKYGKENFLFEILVECPEHLLVSEEHYWATLLNTHDDKYGYNILPTNPEGQIKFTKEIVQKRQNTRRKRAEEKGYWFTEEWKQAARERETGKKQSAETIRKRLETFKKIGYVPKPPSFKGKKLSEYQLKRLSEVHKGKKISEEQIKKTLETRRKNGWVRKVYPEKKPVARKAKIINLITNEVLEFNSLRDVSRFFGKYLNYAHKVIKAEIKCKTHKIEYL